VPRTDPCSAFPKDGDQHIDLSDPLHGRIIARMRYALIVAALILVGCDGRGPTAPTPPPVVVTPPVVVVPPVVTPPAPVFPPNDPQFDLAFYRQFVHDAYDRRGDFAPLVRQTEAPRIYLRTVDDAGAPIDALTTNPQSDTRAHSPRAQ
jgi:hypothetical protein